MMAMEIILQNADERRLRRRRCMDIWRIKKKENGSELILRRSVLYKMREREREIIISIDILKLSSKHTCDQCWQFNIFYATDLAHFILVTKPTNSYKTLLCLQNSLPA